METKQKFQEQIFKLMTKYMIYDKDLYLVLIGNWCFHNKLSRYTESSHENGMYSLISGL